MKKLKILIVEDDQYFRKNIAHQLAQYGRVQTCSDFEMAKKMLNEYFFDIAILDLDLSTGQKLEGLELVKASSNRKIPSVVLTGHVSRDIIEKAFKYGCKHYFSKLDFENEIHTHMNSIMQKLSGNALDDFFKNEFITEDIQLKSKIEYICQQFTGRSNILLTGPTGVGKTKIAKVLHQMNKGKGPFVHLNLSEISENVIESELFGHRKGAFTGANEDKKGILELANGGTLFLDEIGTASLKIQKKLLTAIEEKKFYPVGGTEPITTSFKLISATCERLAELIEKNAFRVDFYFRIKGIEVEIPELKMRRSDIPLIIDHIVTQSAKKVHFSESALEFLYKYHWFGNVRELINLIQSLISTIEGIVTPDALPSYIIKNCHPAKIELEGEQIIGNRLMSYIEKNGLPSLIKKIETEALKSTLDNCQGKINQAIKNLKISKSLFYRIQKDLIESKGQCYEIES